MVIHIYISNPCHPQLF